MALAAQNNDAETHRGVRVVSQRRTGDVDAEYTWLFRREFASVARTAYVIVHDRQAAEAWRSSIHELLVHWRKVLQYDQPEAGYDE